MRIERAVSLLLFCLLCPVCFSGMISAGIPGTGSKVTPRDRAPVAFVDDPRPPQSPVKLIFIHHSTGEAWLNDDHGRLGLTLRDNNYFVSDTNYGWGPADVDSGGGTIGDHTDIGHWYNWFSGPNRDTYTNALYLESSQNSEYSRLASDPGGTNQIIMFKSCFPNSHLGGDPADPIPPITSNPLRGQDANSNDHTIANAKGIYIELLNYFATRTDKLFIVITAPPLLSSGTDSVSAANARAFNNWLVNSWLTNYPHANVAVFDFYNVLTSNGGSTRTDNPNVNDLGWADGNHHRWYNNAVQHIRTINNNYSAYGSSADDSHPTAAGGVKASGEFPALLNIAYNRWRSGTGGCTLSCTATVPSSAQVGAAVSLAATASPSNCTGTLTWDWNFGDGSTHSSQQNTSHAYASAGTYTWTLTVTIGGVVCTKTGTIVITSGVTPPPKATLVSPSGTISTNKPTYVWNAVSSASYYQIWVNDSKTAEKVRTWYTAAGAGCASGTGTCSVTPSTALASGAAQWWIQTWNYAGYGPWSDPMNFTVAGVPDKATLISPSGTIATTTPTYIWNAVSNATWYYLWVNDASTSSGKIKTWYRAEEAQCASGSGTCKVTPATPLTSGAASWWIETWNDAGYGPWSDAMAFTVGGAGPPGKASLISPSGTVTTAAVTYTWNAVATATWYQLWVGDSGGTARIQSWYTAAGTGCASGTGTCSVTPAVALTNGAYTWWIQTWNDYGYGPWSDGMSFTLNCASCASLPLIAYRNANQRIIRSASATGPPAP